MADNVSDEVWEAHGLAKSSMNFGKLLPPIYMY